MGEKRNRCEWCKTILKIRVIGEEVNRRDGNWINEEVWHKFVDMQHQIISWRSTEKLWVCPNCNYAER